MIYIYCVHLIFNLCVLTIWIRSRRSSSCFRSWKPAITGLIINQLAVIALSKLQKQWRTFKHSKKRYWKIFNTKVMKILHCFSLLSFEKLQLQLKKILSNIAETATDLTVNFWVAIFISQSHINQVQASCFCSERKENNDQACAKNKQKSKLTLTNYPGVKMPRWTSRDWTLGLTRWGIKYKYQVIGKYT